MLGNRRRTACCIVSWDELLERVPELRMFDYFVEIGVQDGERDGEVRYWGGHLGEVESGEQSKQGL